MNKIKLFLKKIYNLIIEIRTEQAKRIVNKYDHYLSKSTDLADLERRQVRLARKGLI
jgi:hypothetical protein